MRNNTHRVWCSEAFDPRLAIGTRVGMVAPASSPLAIACQLRDHVKHEEKHSPLLKRYKRTFRVLATTWRGDRSITDDQAAEMVGLVNAKSWQMWRPLVYIIPREPIESAGRLDLCP